MKRAAGGMCILLMVLCTAGSAGAADLSGFRWEPYLTGTTMNETVVNWMASSHSGGTVAYASDAFYRETGGYEQVANADAAEGVFLCHVPLTGLRPDTCYHYQVTAAGDVSGDRTFRTFPESGPFSFIVYGDTQEQIPYFTQAERHALVAERIAAEEPDALFVVHIGDMVCVVEDTEEWDRFFAAGNVLFANTTIMPVLGNHENNETIWYDAFGMPEWYSFDCGAAHFVVLDSNDWAAGHFDEEKAWLAADLDAEREMRETGNDAGDGPVFALFHHPPYSSGTRHPGGWEDLRGLWGPVFEEYGVDMVFSGHVHAYQRYAANGVQYVVAAPGGGMIYNLTEEKTEGYAASADHQLGYLRVTVDGERVSSVFVPVAAVSSDSREIVEIFEPGMEFDRVVVGRNEGIFGIFEGMYCLSNPLKSTIKSDNRLSVFLKLI